MKVKSCTCAQRVDCDCPFFLFIFRSSIFLCKSPLPRTPKLWAKASLANMCGSNWTWEKPKKERKKNTIRIEEVCNKIKIFCVSRTRLYFAHTHGTQQIFIFKERLTWDWYVWLHFFYLPFSCPFSYISSS